MDSVLYDSVADFVDASFAKQSNNSTPRHLQRTVYWLLKFKPDADEALMIAARGHDIERAFFQDEVTKMINESNDGFENKELLRLHQNRGADIIGKFLIEHGAKTALVERVRYLIEHHEEGGDFDQNVLMDADTVSFFENNVERFVNKHAIEQGKDKVSKKFTWMFERITTPQAKAIAQPWFATALAKLEQV
jgi:hypothetical protein